MYPFKSWFSLDMCSGMGLLDHMVALVSFPDGTSGKEHTYQCRRQKRCRFYPWLWKIPWENTISSLHISSAILFSSVRSLSPVQLFATPWTAAHQASLSITNPRSLLKLMSITSVMPSNISSSVVPFSSRLQSFPASAYFQMSQLFTSGGQSIGVSASASVLPMNIQE